MAGGTAVAAPGGKGPSLPGGASRGGSPRGGAPRGGAPRGGGRASQQGNYNPLAPMSMAQIRQQAVKTIGASFAPVYNQLNQEVQQNQAIQDKRTADNQYYLSWLDTQAHGLQAHADAANQTLASLEQNLVNQQNATLNAQPGQMTADANARNGNVSNNANSNTFGVTLPAMNQSNELSTENVAQNAISSMSVGNNQLASAIANAPNFVTAMNDKQVGALNTLLTKIGQQRATLQMKQTDDVQKEIAREQAVNASVAYKNAALGMAGQKLGIQAANTRSEIATRAANIQLGEQRNQLAAERLANQAKYQALAHQLGVQRLEWEQMNADRNFQLHVRALDAKTAIELWQYQHHTGPYKTGSPLSQASQNVIYNKIGELETSLRGLIHGGVQPQRAYQIVSGGGVYKEGTSTVHLPSSTVQLLNAAYNLVTQGGLSPGDVSTLQNMYGLTNVSNQLPVHTSSTPSLIRTGAH